MVTYTYKYNRIIHYFKITRPISKETHPNSEWHHIIPISCNGSDSKENLVLLPTRWHYIVHCWLPGVYLEKGDQKGYEKMLFAWNRMQNSHKDFDNSLKNIKIMSLMYEKLRFEYKQIVGKHTSCSGNKNSQYGKHWWKDPNDKTKSMSIKDGDPVPEGWIRGRWYSKETIDNIRRNNQSRGKCCITNRETKQRKYITKEERKMYGSDWFDGYTEKNLGHFYTSDGENKIFVHETEQPPDGFIPLSEWRQKHKSSTSGRLSEEELNRRKEERVKQFAEKIQQQIPQWIEMYQWYLKNNEDFEAMCKKYSYTKSRDAFLARARKYFPEIFKWDARGGKRGSRPKHRGSYKKHK